MFYGESSKLHYSGFRRFYLKIEFTQSLSQFVTKSICIRFVLETCNESSSAGESLPHALTEPDVNLSAHPAPIVQPPERLRFTQKNPPTAGCPSCKAEQYSPFAPAPLGTFITTTGCSAPVLRIGTLTLMGASHLHFSLSIGTTGSHVPHESLNQVHAVLMPDAIWAVNRFPPDLSRVNDSPRF
jgi:hypothetical protein